MFYQPQWLISALGKVENFLVVQKKDDEDNVVSTKTGREAAAVLQEQFKAIFNGVIEGVGTGGGWDHSSDAEEAPCPRRPRGMTSAPRARAPGTAF